MRIARPLVTCLGNPDRGDDGFGPRVAERLSQTRLVDADVVWHRGDALALIELWQGRVHVVVVDAVLSARPTGVLLHMDVSSDPIPQEMRSASTHALGAGAAIELARTLGRLPARIDVVAACACSFELGSELRPELAQQVEVACQWVAGLVGANVAFARTPV